MSLVENITSVIPQRPPFVMVDELMYADEMLARTAFRVNEENVLVENGKFSEAGIVENIAQTAAAHAGYFFMQKKEAVKMGYIGSIKNLEIFSLPETGNLLTTEIKMINQIFNVTIVEGKIFCCDQLIASCEMKIFIKSD